MHASSLNACSSLSPVVISTVGVVGIAIIAAACSKRAIVPLGKQGEEEEGTTGTAETGEVELSFVSTNAAATVAAAPQPTSKSCDDGE